MQLQTAKVKSINTYKCTMAPLQKLSNLCCFLWEKNVRKSMQGHSRSSVVVLF